MGGRTSLLFLLLCVSGAVSRGIDLQKRLDGGKDCGAKERLYHVELIDDQSKLICGGTLIHEQWILTAAHCLAWRMTARIRKNPSFDVDIEIKLDKKQHIIFETDKKQKDGNMRSWKHDLMLLKLSKPVDPQLPVKLPDCQTHPSPSPSTTAYLTGSAKRETDPKDPTKQVLVKHPRPQCATAEVMECATLKNQMQTKYPKHLEAYADQHWKCFKTTGETCSTDTGGGLVFQIKGEDVIYGVHSFNSNLSCSGEGAFIDICGSSGPATSPNDYLDWIKNTIKTK